MSSYIAASSSLNILLHFLTSSHEIPRTLDATGVNPGGTDTADSCQEGPVWSECSINLHDRVLAFRLQVLA